MTRQLTLLKRNEVIQKPECRAYQTQGIEEMRTLVSEGYRRIILTMPTGGGKTVVAAQIIDLAVSLGKRVLVVVHRIELINQTANQLARFGITDIGVIRGNDAREDDSAAVQVASIDTLRNREKPAADIVFIDEAHRAMADSYRSLFTCYPDALHIGLTATPFRTDNRGLGEVYQKIVTCAKPSQLIQDGFIVSPRIFSTPILPNVTEVEFSTSASDYHNTQLATAMMRPKLVGNMVEEWKTHAEGRRTVVFSVNVEHSKKIVETFREEGIRAAHLDGKTPEQERTEILLRLEKYELQVVSNCDVLSEGWDQPSVKCVILARPTASLRMHMQQCGRILRPWERKFDMFCEAPGSALILDHAGNCYRHGFPQQDRVFDLQTGESRREAGPTLHTCENCYALWSGTSKKCPECGCERVMKERKELQHDESVKLREVDTSRVHLEGDIERQFFLKEVEKCRERGMKPGAAAYRFKEKFGKWPPYAWSARAKAMFNESPDWQQNSDKRAKVRSHWQQHMADKTVEMTENKGMRDDGYTEEPENTYWSDDEIPF